MERLGEKIALAVKINGYEKHYSGFDLGPLNLEIPKGFTTALIGENGAGKSTLLNAIGGISGSRGKINWLEKYDDIDSGNARNEIGWGANNCYFPATWKIGNIKKSLSLAFDNFNPEKFDEICKEFGLADESQKNKKISAYSDGNITRLIIASLLARNTKLLVLDEPDATLDPVIRDKLNSKFREYISNGDGETSILFSTHNVADMEKVVDYAVFLCKGKVLKEGFVEDLREKYRYVHGPKEVAEKLSGMTDAFEIKYTGDYEFEALGITEKCENLGDDVAVEVPSLYQLSVLILRDGEICR